MNNIVILKLIFTWYTRKYANMSSVLAPGPVSVHTRRGKGVHSAE